MYFFKEGKDVLCFSTQVQWKFWAEAFILWDSAADSRIFNIPGPLPQVIKTKKLPHISKYPLQVPLPLENSSNWGCRIGFAGHMPLLSLRRCPWTQAMQSTPWKPQPPFDNTYILTVLSGVNHITSLGLNVLFCNMEIIILTYFTGLL